MLKAICTVGALTLMSAPSLGAAAADAPASMMSPMTFDDGAWCIKAFSKDLCDKVVPGGVRYGTCFDANGNPCRSIWLQNATWKGKAASHDGICFHGCDFAICIGRCDEVKDGELTLTFDAVIRDDAGDCCNYFGCWAGTWELVTEDGRFYFGTANGTIGRGSNREISCDLDGEACETCHEAEWRADLDGWLIAFEGSFNGQDELGRLLCFTADGDWLVKGTCDGGPEFTNDGFKAEAALEGARLDPCFQ